jgi:hypothetical protein
MPFHVAAWHYSLQLFFSKIFKRSKLGLSLEVRYSRFKAPNEVQRSRKSTIIAGFLRVHNCHQPSLLIGLSVCMDLSSEHVAYLAGLSFHFDFRCLSCRWPQLRMVTRFGSGGAGSGSCPERAKLLRICSRTFQKPRTRMLALEIEPGPLDL